MVLEIMLLRNGVRTSNKFSIVVKDTSHHRLVKHVGRVTYFKDTKNWYVTCDFSKYAEFIRKGATVNNRVVDLIDWSILKDWMASEKKRIGLPESTSENRQ